MTRDVNGGNELAWVRLELDILESASVSGTLSEPDRARLAELQRRESELLGGKRRGADAPS